LAGQGAFCFRKQNQLEGRDNSRLKTEKIGKTRPEQCLDRGRRVRNSVSKCLNLALVLTVLAAIGCQRKAAAPAASAGASGQGLPVQTTTVTLAPVPQSSEYVATIKSRRSTAITPQVSGILTDILVHSGDRVKAGQKMMEIDSRQQQSTVNEKRSTERQKKAVLDYQTTEAERQRKLFEAGVTSRAVYDQSQQAFDNAKADYEAAADISKTQQQLLDYYTIRAPYDGVVGDVPVHIGDYVAPSSTTPLTTVDQGKDLEAYIYVPTERAGQVKMGLPIELLDNSGKLIEKTKIDFISAQVDMSMQGILVKAPVHSAPEALRNAQLVKARVIWTTMPMAVVPVLAVSRLSGQPFVYVAKQQNGRYFAMQTAVTLGDTVGNMYSVPAGLHPGDKVIVSGTQFLVNQMPVTPMGG
jgi:RND family efflux transporter MFP subunit